ncbi:DUF885 domain-containing protein [Tsuneonella amylolytica]|uniref:DUF885 domain-containing protein n=1 Tax=Tsuneonella amylolytica TaxID=2338327 RepID=UPI000EA98652|nr:DUF885 family protein [Tsuneonella amylolytica]
MTGQTFKALLAGTAAMAVGACATVPTAEPAAGTPAVAASEPAQTALAAHDALYALFERTDRDMIARNPIAAWYRGDFSRTDTLGNLFSKDAILAERAAAQTAVADLAQIDRASLNADDRIAYDVFLYNQRNAIAGTEPAMLRFATALPVDHFTGFHISYPRLSTPGGPLPFETVADYDNTLKRHAEIPVLMDRAIAQFRTGMANGIVHPRVAVTTMIEQLDTQLKLTTEQSPYWKPVAEMPAGFAVADRTRLTAGFRQAIERDIRPSLQKLRTFLADEYLPKARESVGLGGLPGGDAVYAFEVENSTTLPLTPDAVHRLGLSEVARIETALAAARAEAGTRKPEIYRDKAALTEAWYDIQKKVDPLLPRLFSSIPRTPLEIKPYEEYREKFNLAASYNQGNPDTGKPGTFYFSGYDLPNREVSPTIALFMHEGNPGHHFQIMTKIENEDLPAFLRYGGFTAYSEGWGLYAESLGYELGLYDDPIEKIGAMQGGELLRAVRLVVDTGLHSKGWSRQQAVDYMIAHGQPREFAESETNRYIVMPGQALAYKIGELKIKELRQRAEAALGDRFDVRRFHAQVLDTGALPMPVLEKKIDDWIAAGGV